MVIGLCPPRLKSSPCPTTTASPWQRLPLAAFSVILSVTYERTAPTIHALTATSPPPATLCVVAYLSDATSVVIGDIVTDTVPTVTAGFALNQATSSIYVHLLTYPAPFLWRATTNEPLFPGITFWGKPGLTIEPGARLYEGGNVTIYLLFHRLVLFVFSSYFDNWLGDRRYYHSAFLLITGPISFTLIRLPCETSPSSDLLHPVLSHDG